MRAAIAVGAWLLLFGVLGDEHGFRAVIRAAHDERQMTARVAELRAENAALRRQAAALRRREPEAIEREARQTLGLAKPGELVVTRGR